MFDTWIKKLPKERQFIKSKIPKEKLDAYESYKNIFDLEETDDYDLAGAFLSGQEPDENGHLGSFGINGKLLKSPNHETVWKTAFTELYHKFTNVYPDIGELTREDAIETIRILIKQYYGDTKLPDDFMEQ